MHISLGLTYTFDTYEQGMYHFNEALYLSKKNNMYNHITLLENHNIPFLSAHFNQVEGITTTDKSEMAHIEIAKGNFSKAIEILEGIKGNSPFKLYYLGIASKDRDILLRSYSDFIEKRSDHFFCRLPLNMLKHL